MNVIVITTNTRLRRIMVLLGLYFNEMSKAAQNNIADIKLAIQSPLRTMKNAPQKLPPM
jgi:hypothetical protein